jgi:hypothetical protein
LHIHFTLITNACRVALGGVKPIGPNAGVVYSQLFIYTQSQQHIAGFTENSNDYYFMGPTPPKATLFFNYVSDTNVTYMKILRRVVIPVGRILIKKEKFISKCLGLNHFI